jgi:hypothetical protein
VPKPIKYVLSRADRISKDIKKLLQEKFGVSLKKLSYFEIKKRKK